jgi:hypothetical protein
MRAHVREKMTFRYRGDMDMNTEISEPDRLGTDLPRNPSFLALSNGACPGGKKSSR